MRGEVMKCNELLLEVVHLASAAIVADDEAIKRQAMADIIDAMACVIPTERVAARGGSANRSKIRAINGYTAVVAKADVMGRKFYAEAQLGDKYYVADVYEDRDVHGVHGICRIIFDEHCGGNAVMKMLHGVLGGISSHYGHKARNKANRRAREAALKEEA